MQFFDCGWVSALVGITGEVPKKQSEEHYKNWDMARNSQYSEHFSFGEVHTNGQMKVPIISAQHEQIRETSTPNQREGERRFPIPTQITPLL